MRGTDGTSPALLARGGVAAHEETRIFSCNRTTAKLKYGQVVSIPREGLCFVVDCCVLSYQDCAHEKTRISMFDRHNFPSCVFIVSTEGKVQQGGRFFYLSFLLN